MPEVLAQIVVEASMEVTKAADIQRQEEEEQD